MSENKLQWKAFNKAVTILLGSWFILYIILSATYATFNLGKTPVFHDMSARCLITIASIACFITTYFVTLINLRPADGWDYIQNGGLTISDETSQTLNRDIKKLGNYVRVSKRASGKEYRIEILNAE